MNKNFLVLLLITFLILFSVSALSIQTPIPFKINIQKNTTLYLQPHINLEEPMHFNYIEFGGYCNEIEPGEGTMAVNFYNKTALAKTISRKFSTYGRFDGFHIELEGIEADNAYYIDVVACPGLLIDNMHGKLEATQNLKETETITSIKINAEPESIGVLPPNIQIRNPSTDSRIIDESVQIVSSNPNVLVWFGNQDSADKPTTTKNVNDQIYACSYLGKKVDEQNKPVCDSKAAELATCDLSAGNDWYKGWCCSQSDIKSYGCRYDSTLNAFCGNNSNGDAQLATPEEIGEIHDFTGCTQKSQAVFDESAQFHACKTGANFGTIKIQNHDYNCDASKPEIKECGGEQPISTFNKMLTGENLTISGKLNYCLETAAFSPNLDYTTQKSCEKSGQTWTGTRCCSEQDDRINGNEYYNDLSTDTNTQKPGGCWNSTYIYAGNYTKNYTNNSQTDSSIINYNGTFYGCLITDPTLLALQNTESHLSIASQQQIEQQQTQQQQTQQTTTGCYDSDGGTITDLRYNIRGTTSLSTGQTETDTCVDSKTLLEKGCDIFSSIFSTQYICPGICVDGACTDIIQYQLLTGNLILPQNKCGSTLRNALKNDITPNAVCQPWGQWIFTANENDTVEKINPIGPDKTQMPLTWKCDKQFQEAGCCQQTKCWNGKQCINSGEFFDATDKGYMCNNGNWIAKTKKTNYDKTEEGFCEQEEQCLVTSVKSLNNENKDNQPAEYFKANGVKSRMPRCITDKQYLKDEYCENGNWTTRTKLLVTQLLSLADTVSNKNYDLFCDSYNNVLNEFKHTDSQGIPIENFIKENCAKEGRTVPCTNNFCVLKTQQGVAALATSVNTEVNGSQSFLRAFNLNQHACDNTLTGTEFTQCSQTPIQGGQLWHNPQIESMIYTSPIITQQLQTNIQDQYIPQELQSMINYVRTINSDSNPATNFWFFNQTRLYNRITYSKKDSREIFAFLEKQPARNDNVNYLAVKYANFSLNADPCLTLFKNTLQNQAPFCESQLDASQFVLVARDISENAQQTQFPKWRDLTAKLRLTSGPPKSVTTDTTQTQQSTTQSTTQTTIQTTIQECPQEAQ